MNVKTYFFFFINFKNRFYCIKPIIQILKYSIIFQIFLIIKLSYFRKN